jgi:sulfonate transport system substrate-binding protein
VKALRTVGLGLGDIEAIDLGPPDAAPAFANNQIDAWVIWDPYFAIAQQQPDTRVLTTTEGILDSWGFYLANGTFARDNANVLVEVIDELGKVGAFAQANLDDTVDEISQSTGIPVDIQKIALTRKGADLGSIHPLNEEHLAYQQALADEFYELGIVPKKLDIGSAFWYAPAVEG